MAVGRCKAAPALGSAGSGHLSNTWSAAMASSGPGPAWTGFMLYCAKRFVWGGPGCFRSACAARIAGNPAALAVHVARRPSAPLLAAGGVRDEAELGAKVAAQWLSLSSAAHAKFDRDAIAATTSGLATRHLSTQFPAPAALVHLRLLNAGHELGHVVLVRDGGASRVPGDRHESCEERQAQAGAECPRASV